jgi:hypothetical protein
MACIGAFSTEHNTTITAEHAEFADKSYIILCGPGGLCGWRRDRW